MDPTKRAFAALQSEKLLLTELSIALSENSPSANLVDLLVDQLQKITKCSLSAYMKYDRDRHCLIPVLIKTEQKPVQQVIRDLEEEFLHNGLPVSEPDYRNVVSQGVGVSKSLHEISFGIIPESFERKVQSARIFDRYYWIAFSVSETLYGAAFFALKKNQPSPSSELLHFFSWLAAVSIRRHQEEDTAREMLANLERIEKIANLGHYEINFSTGKAYWSKEIFNIFGLDPSWGEPTIQNYQKLVFAEDVDAVYDMFEKSRTEGKPFDLIYRIKKLDGSVRYVHSRSETFCDDTGKPVKLLGTIQDITERILADMKLDHSDEKYTALFRNMAEGVFYQAADGSLIDVNDSALRLLGLTREQFSGRTSYDPNWKVMDCHGHILPPEEHPSMIALRTGKKIIDFELAVFNPRINRITWLLVNATPQFFSNAEKPDQVFVTLRNNTGHKLAEQELRESEEKYRNIFENATEGIFQSTPQGRYISVNPAFAKMAGFESPTDMIQSVKDIGKELYTRQEVRKNLEALISENGSVSAFEAEINRRNDTSLWVSINCHAVYDHSGEIRYYEGTCNDITSTKEAEKQLRIKDFALNSSINAIGLCDLQGNMIFANDAFVNLWGYREHSEILGRHISEFANSKEQVTKVVAGLMEGTGFIGEVESVRKDGSVFDTELTANVVVLPDGQPVSMMASFINISERKKIFSDLRESEEKFRAAFTASPDSISITSLADGMYVDVNESFLEMSGYTREEVIGRTAFEINIWRNQADRSKITGELRKHGFIINGEADFIKKDGTILTGLMSARMLDLNGKPHLLAFTRNITERKAQELALRESERKYRLLAENIADVIWTMDLEGRFTFVSPSIQKLRGYTVEEVMCQNMVEVLTPASATKALKLVQETLHLIESGAELPEPFPLILEQPCKDGTTIWTEAVVQPIFSAEGVHTGYLGVSRNISERVRAEEELTRAEYRFRALIENAPDGVVMISPEGDFNYISPAARKIFSYENINVSGFKPNELTHPDDLPMVYEALAKLIADPSYTPVLQYRFLANDGTWRWIESTFTNLLEEPGIMSIVINFRDITERKLAEMAMLQSEARLYAFMKHVPALILIKDHELRPVFANERLYQSFPMEKWLGKKPHELFPKDVADLMVEKDMLALQEGYVAYEEAWADKTGQQQIYFTQKFRIDIPGDQPLLGSIITDISDRKHAEEEIMSLNLSLERRVEERTSELIAANKELEAFAYTVSHDLRAPVRAIGGFTRILEEDYLQNLDDEGQRVFRVILENTCKMEQLIDDLLSFSRLSRADMNLSTVDMAGIAHKCFEDLTDAEMKRKIGFTVSDFPLIRGDYPMLVQVWTNLLSNAIKYTSQCEHPEIWIDCNWMDNEFAFSIGDNGIGFDMKYADRLFGVFQRLHSDKEYEGTGVGLAIVQRIIHRHGGRIWAEAEPTKGAKFYFTLRSA